LKPAILASTSLIPDNSNNILVYPCSLTISIIFFEKSHLAVIGFATSQSLTTHSPTVKSVTLSSSPLKTVE